LDSYCTGPEWCSILHDASRNTPGRS